MIYLAALQDIPRELVDAASVDGARRWGTLRHVILPQLLPVTVFLVVWQTLLSLQLFDLVYATTRGGPLDATMVIVYFIYNQAFELFNAGYAAAVAYIVAVFLIAARLHSAPPPAPARPPAVSVAADTAVPPGGSRRSRPSRRSPAPGSRLPFSPWHLVLAPVAIVFALPFIWMLLSSLMSNAQINQFPPTIIPDSPSPDGWTTCSATRAFRTGFSTRLIVALVTVASNLVFCSLAGYAFARMRFRGSTLLFLLILATLIIPFQLTMIPTFIVMDELGLVDTLGGADRPGPGHPARRVPDAPVLRQPAARVEEAARIDGCSRLGCCSTSRCRWPGRRSRPWPR